MTLYEINREILECIDAETGEVLDIEKLEALSMEKETKLENTILWVKELDAEEAAIKNEIANLTARLKRIQNTRTSVKNYLGYSLKGERFSTAKCELTWKKSESVNIPDETLIPKKYLTKTVTFKPDKAAIKAAIKAGLKVKGAEIVSKLNPQIK